MSQQLSQRYLIWRMIALLYNFHIQSTDNVSPMSVHPKTLYVFSQIYIKSFTVCDLCTKNIYIHPCLEVYADKVTVQTSV